MNGCDKMILEDLWSNLLQEAEGDEENTTSDNTGESDEENTPPATETNDNDDADDTPAEDDDDADADTEDEEEETDEGTATESTVADDDVKVVGNPHAKRIYFDRFKYMKALINELLTTMDKQEVYYKNDDKTEVRNLNTVKYLTRTLHDTREQIEYLLKDGAIISLDIKAIQKIYARMRTKIDTCMKMYAKMLKIEV